MADRSVLVETEALCVRFPGEARDAIADVSLSIRAGECVAVLGPSGSGKSTLALALAGAIPHLVPAERRGVVRWLGRDPQPDVAAGAGLAALVMQDADAQLVALTVEEELAFALENRDLPAREIDARMDATLAAPPALGLKRSDATLSLSAGWRQRLALAAALAERPSLLVIDEPTAHLDERAAAAAIEAIRAARAQGSAALLIEHRADLALGVADRIVGLDDHGRIVADGPPEAALAALAALPGANGLRLPKGMIQTTARPRPATDRPTPGAVQLLLDGVDLPRGGRLALDGVSFALRAGEIVGLAGPNGAGKTSLALALAGGLSPSKGRAARPGGAPAFVPQNPVLAFASPTLGQEAARRGVSWEEAARALAAFGIASDAARHPLRHSRGELRRIALALAFADPRPRPVLLDEPTSGLDARGLERLSDDLARLAARGSSVLVISHDLEFLYSIASRIVRMENGRIVSDGPVDE